MMKRYLAVLLVITIALLTALPAGAQSGDIRYFPETNHSLGHGFLTFWNNNGGLPVFGYPLTDETTATSADDGKTYTIQFLERQRFEYHPENTNTPYAILLGRLGVEVLRNQGRDWLNFPKASPNTPHYSPQTGHAIASQFWDYWRGHGLDLGDRGISTRESLALFGYPISEPQMEANAGVPVLTQWFERARFEYHPTNPAPYKILLGRLGAETQGIRTTQPALLKPLGTASVLPIISTGDTLPNGYRFASLPDGIGILPNTNGTADIFINHETSTVPFPAIGSPGAAADMNNAEISRLRLRQNSGEVLSGDNIWPSNLNFIRFCSGSIAGEREGFRQPIFFSGEETNDIISQPPNPAWPPNNAQRQAGYAIAVEARTGKRYVIPGMGRMNHENTVVIPVGWNQIIALTDDDTFNAPAAQLYMYTAPSAQDMLDDKGQLYAFLSDDPGINDYGDLSVGTNVSGRFIAVPRDIALGDQDALENWSNANNVFQFIRTEDIAYDKNDPHIIYIADTGEPRAIADSTTGRLKRGPSTTKGPYPNGKIFKMTLSTIDPRRVDRLEVLIDADAAGYNSTTTLHNPDNLDTSTGSLMIQEDPISTNNFDPGAGPNARIWRYDLQTGTLAIVAEVDQSLDPKAKAGNWESSGIVNATDAFGPGSWLVNVQAHSLWIETTPAENYTKKLEGGQLLLLRIPGS